MLGTRMSSDYKDCEEEDQVEFHVLRIACDGGDSSIKLA